MQSIITQDGITPITQLKPHHWCFDEKGQKNKILEIKKRKTQLYKVVFKPEIASTLPIDQQILIDKSSWKWLKHCKSWRLIELKDLIGKVENKQKWNRWYFQTPPILELDGEISIDPYIVGLMVGDGSLTSNNFSIVSSDIEIITEMKRILGSDYDIQLRRNRDYDYYISYQLKRNTNPLKSEFKNLNMYGKSAHEKNINKLFLLSNINNRIKLLQGLMDTDGTSAKSGCPTFCTTSKKLRDEFIFLCKTLGGTPSYSIKSPFYYDKNRKRIYGKSAYVVSSRLPSFINPFLLNRKAERYMNRFNSKTGKLYEPTLIVEEIKYLKDGFWWEIKTEKKTYVNGDFVVIRQRE